MINPESSENQADASWLSKLTGETAQRHGRVSLFIDNGLGNEIHSKAGAMTNAAMNKTQQTLAALNQSATNALPQPTVSEDLNQDSINMEVDTGMLEKLRSARTVESGDKIPTANDDALSELQLSTQDQENTLGDLHKAFSSLTKLPNTPDMQSLDQQTTAAFRNMKPVYQQLASHQFSFASTNLQATLGNVTSLGNEANQLEAGDAAQQTAKATIISSSDAMLQNASSTVGQLEQAIQGDMQTVASVESSENSHRAA